MGAENRSWGDVKTIKYGKRSASSSDVLEEQSIVYTYTCIESAIIEQYHSDKQLNDKFSSHIWNEQDDTFGKQLEQWSVDKLFSDQSEPVKRQLRTYIQDWVNCQQRKMIK